MAAGRKKAVIFDMDGVLIDSEMVYLRSMLAFARKRRPEITESDLLGVVGRSAKDSWEIVERLYQMVRPGRSCGRNTAIRPMYMRPLTIGRSSARKSGQF